jgi:hypothetical protein
MPAYKAIGPFGIRQHFKAFILRTERFTVPLRA